LRLLCKLSAYSEYIKLHVEHNKVGDGIYYTNLQGPIDRLVMASIIQIYKDQLIDRLELNLFDNYQIISILFT